MYHPLVAGLNAAGLLPVALTQEIYAPCTINGSKLVQGSVDRRAPGKTRGKIHSMRVEATTVRDLTPEHSLSHRVAPVDEALYGDVSLRYQKAALSLFHRQSMN